MTLIEHIKSDLDVLKLIAISIGTVFLCVVVLWLLILRYSEWRKTILRKRKELQRPFVTKRISLTPRDDSPTFIYGPFNNLSQDKQSSSPKKKLLQTPVSPTYHEKTNPKSFKSSPVKHHKEQERNISPTFLGQIISCINKSKPNASLTFPKRHFNSPTFNPLKDYKTPFILDNSATDDQDSTLPCLLLSSDSSLDNIMEKKTPDAVEQQPFTSTTKLDKGVNTEFCPEDNKMNNNNKDKNKDKELKTLREHKWNQIPRLWSHKCHFSCHSKTERRKPYTWNSKDSNSSNGDPHTDQQDEQDYKQTISEFDFEQSANSPKKCSGNQIQTRKFSADVCVQTEFSEEIENIYGNKQGSSPLCSSDSTLKENDTSAKCCCMADHKQHKSQSKLKAFSVVNTFESEYAEDSDFLENGPSISDRTSFIPAKSWYSLGSLCDENENCKTCGGNISSVPHFNHTHSDDSDNKLNQSTLDAISYNDTGYTSTEEESITNSEHSKDTSSVEHHSSLAENGSYDGDYESDDEIYRCRLVASDDMVYKPLPSISEPFSIQAYATREWTGHTPTAEAIRKGYAAISNHITCHQLRQIRGDNYCAIRATLFQALVNGIAVLDTFTTDNPFQLLRKLISSTQGGLEEWSFAGRIEVEKPNVVSTLEEILRFYVDTVRECEELCTQQAKTEYLLSLFNEETGNNDFRLLEAVKVIMLYHAVRMYEDMNQGKDVPIVAWLLFARDSSRDPRGLLQNHLNHVGDSGGLEQIEMCLLGYALGLVIQVFRPSQVNKQDFIANYPYLEDVPPLTPMVSLVAEDDRHYNILVD